MGGDRRKAQACLEDTGLDGARERPLHHSCSVKQFLQLYAANKPALCFPTSTCFAFPQPLHSRPTIKRREKGLSSQIGQSSAPVQRSAQQQQQWWVEAAGGWGAGRSLQPLVEQERVNDTVSVDPLERVAHQRAEGRALAGPQHKLAAGLEHFAARAIAPSHGAAWGLPSFVNYLDLLTTVGGLPGEELVDLWAGSQLARVTAHFKVWGGTFITF